MALVSTSHALTVGGGCTTNGALAANPENKTQYYFCMDKKIYLGTCTDGRTFDERVGQCVYAGTDPGTGTTVNCDGNDYATFPYPNDNTRYYYCYNGQALVVQCPANNYYDSTSRTCVLGSGTGTGGYLYCPTGVNTVLPDPNGDCQRYVLCLNGQGSYQTCPNGFYFQPTGYCGLNMPNSCAGGGPCNQRGLLRPVRNNCQVYNYCDGSYWSTIKCPRNYYFSPSRLTCGPTIPNGCSKYNNYNQNLPGSNSVYPTYPTYPFIPTTPTDPSVVCATSMNGIFADTTNCQKYFYCMDGLPYTATCPSGYYFNPLTRACGPNIPSGCTVQDIDLDTPTVPVNSEITLADPTNCKQYIVYTNGFGATYACGPGLYYDIEGNSCSTTKPDRCT
ncbi:peritrophin-44-like [Hermetia illucens]|nr:peritrophin-44-like [Hermetia illucens]